MTATGKSKYRPEIDGLRAFAVIAVIVNHFNKNLLPSGYLGVDIFFVISGYVITSSLADRKSTNFLHFLTGFYQRRIKRLMPLSALFILITSILISLFNPDPEISLGIGWRALFGISNIALYQASTDYFAESTELNPFTHTWSLGVEEQFYLLFPFLIWISGFGQHKVNGARNLFFWIGSLAIASVICFIYLYHVNQPAAYFLMPPRFWEMAAGCLIFIGYKKRAKVEEALERVPPLLVLVAMVGVMLMPAEVGMPATISIVVLSAVLVACLKKGTAAFDFFTREQVVYIGLISFSLYLWHWTVLSISRWTIGIHWWSVPFQVVFMVLLASASYKFVETPLRRRIWFDQRWKSILSVLVLVMVPTTFSLMLSKAQVNPIFTGTRRLSSSNRVNMAEPSRISLEHCMDFRDLLRAFEYCKQPTVFRETRSTIWLMGDSHAFALVNTLRDFAAKQKSNLRVIARRATAFPVPKNYLKLRTLNAQEDLISNSFMSDAQKLILREFRSGDILIISLRFPMHFGPDTHEYREEDFTYRTSDGAALKGSKSKFFEKWLVELESLAVSLGSKGGNLVVMGPVPEWKLGSNLCDPQWFRISSTRCLSSRSVQYGLHSESISMLKALSRRRTNIHVVDTMKYLCSKTVCSFADIDGFSLYNDDDHLNDYAAAKYVLPAIQAQFDSITHD